MHTLLFLLLLAIDIFFNIENFITQTKLTEKPQS